MMLKFDELLADWPRHTSRLMLARAAYERDRFVYNNALALFLYSPKQIYAVNREVSFYPCRTSVELAECKVSDRHWSLNSRT
jgi:peptide/nickel transport system substrate-binding protein